MGSSRPSAGRIKPFQAMRRFFTMKSITRLIGFYSIRDGEQSQSFMCLTSPSEQVNSAITRRDSSDVEHRLKIAVWPVRFWLSIWNPYPGSLL